MVKKKKRKRKRGKKISLPNNVAPITVVPHENIIVEGDALDDDLVMPIACCDDYDWEDNDTSYDLENLLALAWNNMIIMFAILLVLSILLMMRVIMLMI